MDAKKNKVGYEIPFTRTFYEYKPIEPAADIAKRIEAHEKKLMADLKALFRENGTTGTHGTTGTLDAENPTKMLRCTFAQMLRCRGQSRPRQRY